ncbi:uncharacterized protein LOC143251579 [Tachypleus tridentatus]|uniref:uncharacterized protein LOC143251579 n=1 Tax=Tachypleus tridentatus TaxID=6853 RepID=UPI003FD47ABB
MNKYLLSGLLEPETKEFNFVERARKEELKPLFLDKTLEVPLDEGTGDEPAPGLSHLEKENTTVVSDDPPAKKSETENWLDYIICTGMAKEEVSNDKLAQNEMDRYDAEAGNTKIDPLVWWKERSMKKLTKSWKQQKTFKELRHLTSDVTKCESTEQYGVQCNVSGPGPFDRTSLCSTQNQLTDDQEKHGSIEKVADTLEDEKRRDSLRLKEKRKNIHVGLNKENHQPSSTKEISFKLTSEKLGVINNSSHENLLGESVAEDIILELARVEEEYFQANDSHVPGVKKSTTKQACLLQNLLVSGCTNNSYQKTTKQFGKSQRRKGENSEINVNLKHR